MGVVLLYQSSAKLLSEHILLVLRPHVPIPIELLL